MPQLWKMGHLAKVCCSQQTKPPQQASYRGRGESEGFCETPVLKVKGPREKPPTVTLEIDGVQVPMEIDTGAAVSLISEGTQKRMFPKRSLRQPEVHLNTYTLESIPEVEVLRVQVKY